MHKATPPPFIWAFVAIATFLTLLYFGLQSKGLPSSNPVHLDADKGRLIFKKYGIAFAEFGKEIEPQNNGEPETLTIEMAVRAADTLPAFKSLLMLHDGSDDDQLIVGQWKSSIVIMNGDDYDNRRRLPKVILANFFSTHETQFLTILASKGKTQLFLNGNRVRTKSHWQLKLPKKVGAMVMVVGNSVNGKLSWAGEFSYLTLLGRALSPSEIKNRYTAWEKNNSLSPLLAGDSLAAYTFGGQTGSSIPDLSGFDRHLEVPLKPTVLKKNFLASPRSHFKPNRSFFIDTTLNFFGFIPLGAFLFGWLYGLKLPGSRFLWVTVVLLCFAFSLSMEVAQAWSPSRSSSLLDLFFNTLGACVGVWGVRKKMRGADR